jgi:hypothetical protein
VATDAENRTPIVVLTLHNAIVAFYETYHLFIGRGKVSYMMAGRKMFLMFVYFIINGMMKEYDLYLDLRVIIDYQKSDETVLYHLSISVYLVAVITRVYATLKVTYLIYKNRGLKIDNNEKRTKKDKEFLNLMAINFMIAE